MPDVDTSIYRVQPQQQQFNPLQALQMMDTATRLGSDLALGDIVRQSADPNSSYGIDLNKFNGLVANDPRISRNALPMLTAAQGLKQAGYAADTAGVGLSQAQYNLRAGQTRAAVDMFGSLANMPNPTKSDFISHALAYLRATGADPGTVAPWIENAPNDPKALRKWAYDMQNIAQGAAATAAPTTTTPTKTGVPQVAPLGAVGYQAGGVAAPSPRGQPAPPIAMPVGQAPGESEVQVASAARANDLQKTAASTAQYHADLDNLRQESKVLENLGGPTVETEKKLNQLTQRLGGFGLTMSPDQLRALESFDKIANQISLNQSKLFHGSDAGLHTVVGANPSSGMSRYGREGVIDMLQGNQDAIDQTRKLWFDARSKGATASDYDLFIHEMSKVMDPRVFQFNRLSRDNQQKFLSQMDPTDIPDFEKKYQYSVDKGWVKPLKKAK